MARTIVDEFITILGFETNLAPAEAAKKVMDQIREAGKKLAMTLTGTAAAIGYFAVETVHSVVAESNFAKSLGVSYESLQTYQYAIEQLGGSADSVKSDIDLLAQGAMRSGQSLEQYTASMADTFKGMSDIEATKLGEGLGFTPDTIRLLKQGKEGVEELFGEARGQGAIIPENQIKAAQKFEEVLHSLQSTITAVYKRAILGAMPEMTELLEHLKDWVKTNRQLIETALRGFIEGVSSGLKIAVGVLSILMTVLKPLIWIISTLTQSMLGTAIIAGVVATACLALAAIMAMALPLAVGKSIIAIIQFAFNLKTSYAWALLWIQTTPWVQASFARIALSLNFLKVELIKGIAVMGSWWRMVMTSPRFAAAAFAASLKSAMLSAWSFAATLTTKTIPALVRTAAVMIGNVWRAVVGFTVSMISAAIPACIAFATALFTTVIPAVWAFTAALWANPITWIVAAVIAAIAAIVGAIVLLTMWFDKLWKSTGSMIGAIKVMGQTFMKALLMPINVVIDSIRGLLNLLGKIPGVGKIFRGASEGLKNVQDKTNQAVTGSTDKYDLTSPTKGAIAQGQAIASNQIAINNGISNHVAPVQPVSNHSANSTSMNQIININGAANPNEVAREVANRTSNTLQSIAPGMTAPIGAF